jgi:threonine aldolase
MISSKNFASDNCSGIHPEIMKSIIAANSGHTLSYGDDEYTHEAEKKFREHLGEHIDVFPVWGGTASNVLGLSAVLRPFEAIICPECAHINTDETGAPERFLGSKLLAIPSPDGKIAPQAIEKFLTAQGNTHKVQPRVISITESTEMGTVYTPEEIRKMAEFAHGHGLLLHVDGARIGNAAAYLNVNLRELLTDTGVDLLSFGGTKSGMMGGEAVVFFNKDLSRDFRYIRKQGMQLASKMRFISAQYIALLSNDLLFSIARHTNAMAKLLESRVKGFPGVVITQKVETNAVHATIPAKVVKPLQKRFYFHVRNRETSLVRWMTSFDTTAEDVEQFAQALEALL